MQINEILAALRYERQQFDEAIRSLERINRGRGKFKKLGRPPGTKNKPKLVRLALISPVNR